MRVESEKPADGSVPNYKDMLRESEVKRRSLGAKDVLNEQRTCEEYSEDDQPYPT